MKTDVSFEAFFNKAAFSAYGWSPPREYPALTEIMQQDRPATAVYFIEYGLVKLSRFETSGREVIAGLRRRNWIIGAPAVFLGKKYSFTITALVDCKIRHISPERFLSIIETNREFSMHMLRMFSQEIYNYGKMFCNLGCLPAIDRLKRLLYEIMLEINHSSVYKEQVELNFPLKHKELAQMIAVTPEHLSRLLKQLERDGIIKREKGLLVLNYSQSLTKEC
jgi:CRP/FNR family transcriptional regulator